MYKKIILSFSLFLLLPLACSAHLPRLVVGQNPNLNNPVVIQEPKISQVFYGQLIGDDQYYSFNLPKQTKILLGLLTPIDEKNWPNLELIAREGRRESLAGSFTKVYFEEFGGDYYLQGPEKTFNLNAGGYILKISNASSTGRYALVVGKEESFTAMEVIKTYLVLPLVKEKFFGKPIWENFAGLLGIILILSSIALFQIKFQTRRWLLLFGVIFFSLSAGIISFNHPFNLIGWLKVAISAIAMLVGIVANLRLWNNNQFNRNLQYAVWLVVILLMVCMI
ncbi:MAG: hypothetical protein NTV48_03070 [Candidatus Vogelbacteria bacterium]|nr:hypothetical protein [Candidatus Vogelbacteria bacterium]